MPRPSYQDKIKELRKETVELSGRLSNFVDEMSVDDPRVKTVHRADDLVAQAKHVLYSAETQVQKVILELDRNNAGRSFISATYIRDEMAYRVRVLSHADEYTADAVMEGRFNDMLALMGDNVTGKITEAFTKRV